MELSRRASVTELVVRSLLHRVLIDDWTGSLALVTDSKRKLSLLHVWTISYEPVVLSECEAGVTSSPRRAQLDPKATAAASPGKRS